MSGFLQRLADRTLAAEPAVHSLRSEPFVDSQTAAQPPLFGDRPAEALGVARPEQDVATPPLPDDSATATPRQRLVPAREAAGEEGTPDTRRSPTRRRPDPLIESLVHTRPAAPARDPAAPPRLAGRAPSHTRPLQEPRAPLASPPARAIRQHAGETHMTSDAAATEVHVHIGRIEVTAVRPTAAAPAVKPAQQPRSLASYLDQRSERRS